MGRSKKERKESSSEDDSSSSKEEDRNSSDESDNPKEKEELEESAASAERDSKRKKKQTNVGKSRWESPDSRKRRHSPSQNQEKRKSGPRDRQDGFKKSEKNEKEKETDRDFEKKRKDDDNRINKNERRDLHDREHQHRENNRDQERQRERERAPQSHQRNDNRENQNRSNDKFDRQKSPPAQRREDRNRRFDDRDNRQNNRTNNERGRRGGGGRGRSNRFSNNEGARSRFDGSRMKSEPSPEWGKAEIKNEGDEKGPIEKEKPNFEPSGKLTEDANTVNGVVIKYTEPLESRKPKRRWRLYPFKGEKALPTLYVHRQSAFLMGRDRKVADIPLDHPSCSKQHAALQFRLVPFARENGGEGKRVRPYLIDLESANGTFVNDVKLEARRYHELLERDVLKFGFSSREYVLLHEQSKDDALDDDVDLPGVKQE